MSCSLLLFPIAQTTPGLGRQVTRKRENLLPVLHVESLLLTHCVLLYYCADSDSRAPLIICVVIVVMYLLFSCLYYHYHYHYHRCCLYVTHSLQHIPSIFIPSCFVDLVSCTVKFIMRSWSSLKGKFQQELLSIKVLQGTGLWGNRLKS